MILFLNHQEPRCGVYQMGRRIAGALGERVRYCEGVDAARIAAAGRPSAIVYNWHGSTLPWAPEIMQRCPTAKHVGIIHEISPETAGVDAHMFSCRMVCDPLFPVDNRSLFRSVRHVPRFEGSTLKNQRFTVGSFGFAVGGKMFSEIVRVVSREFPGSLLRLHISRAHYGDDSGSLAETHARACREATSSGVEVSVTHDFMGESDLIAWLAANDVNVFFYETNPGRGIASALDYAIAAQRPVVINGSQMFRHVRDRLGFYPERGFKSLAENTGFIVESLYREWSPERLVRDYQKMFDALGVS